MVKEGDTETRFEIADRGFSENLGRDEFKVGRAWFAKDQVTGVYYRIG